MFVCDEGTSVVSRGSGMPCQGALLVSDGAARSPTAASTEDQLTPCFFASGSRQVSRPLILFFSLGLRRRSSLLPLPIFHIASSSTRPIICVD